MMILPIFRVAPCSAYGRRLFSSSARDARQVILQASLKHVNRRGWTKEALAQGSVDAGYLPVTHGLFPRGAAELAEFWMEKGNEDLKAYLEKLAKENGGSLSSEQVVVLGLRKRLEHSAPYLRSWPQAMALGLHPENASSTLQKLHQIPELLCKFADDIAGTADWDDRKCAVGGIYAASELYMLTDYSEGYADTWKFVEARVRDALFLEEKLPVHTLATMLNGLGSLASSAATMLSPLAPKPSASPFPEPEHIRQHVTEAANKFHNIVTSRDTAWQAPSTHGSSTPSSPPPSTSSPRASAPVSGVSSDASSGGLDPFHVAQVEEEETALETVRLPSGMSLFGLMSMKANEAATIVQSSNPSFQVMITKVSDASAEPVFHPRVVRLLVDDDDVVVDVLRS